MRVAGCSQVLGLFAIVIKQLVPQFGKASFIPRNISASLQRCPSIASAVIRRRSRLNGVQDHKLDFVEIERRRLFGCHSFHDLLITSPKSRLNQHYNNGCTVNRDN